MGTKRVGMARVKSLINENNNQLVMRRTQTKSVSADATLTVADMGKLIVVDGSSAGNITITLPAAPPVGAELKVILGKNNNAATQVLLESNHSGNKFEGFAVQLLASSNATAYHSHRRIGFTDSAKLGSMIHCVCVDATAGAVRWAIIDSKCDLAFINALS